MMKTIRIGTRGSTLALWQAEHVRDLLCAAHPSLGVEIVVVKTKGDKILDVALSKIGDKGLFTKELERVLMDGEVDICVHSMKDMPTNLPEGLSIAAMPTRADASDVLVSDTGIRFADLPAGSRVATGSLRRTAQLKALRPDIELCEIRGNVETRLQKALDGTFDAVVLAKAGIQRLGLDRYIADEFNPNVLIPAVGQGAIGIEARADDADTAALLAAINDDRTFEEVSAERRIMAALEGGCQVPIGAHAAIDDDADETRLSAVVSSLDGTRQARFQGTSFINGLYELTDAALAALRAQGAWEILESIR